VKGSWNDGPGWEVVSDPDAQRAVDGGDGAAAVGFTAAERAVVLAMAARTASDASADPQTGAELGMGVDEAWQVGSTNGQMIKP
jgi:Mn-containing catalase